MKVSEIILGKGRDRKRRGPRPGWEKRIGLHNRLKDTANDDSQIKSVISESGSLPGVGAIHISEIEPTLSALEKILGIDLKNNTLGSVGKKQFSGDIDIALKIDAEQIPEFMDRLSKIPEISDITKTSVIMTKVKIVGYDPRKQVEGKERTGYVQVDFMPGDPDWMKVFYHAPHEKNSKYKGVMRTTFISTIAAIYNQDNSEKTTEDGRPLESKRFMFSPRDGLVRVLRTPMPNKKGDGYTKQNKNEIIDGPWKTADKIADILNLGTGDDLDSFETLYNAVKKNYDTDTATRIFKDFANAPLTKELGVPEEVKGYANV
jgi:hypothetical protein